MKTNSSLLTKIKNSFNNKNLFEQALTHKSWINEHPGQRNSNERLEFLGDAVLELITSKFIYEKFPEKGEGYLTALRANLVNTKNLSLLAMRINLGGEIYLSRGEEEGGGRENPSLLADSVEALIGAIYLDSGLKNVEELLEEYLFSEIPDKVGRDLKDPKSRLQEKVQSKGLLAPKYRVASEVGPDHNKTFKVEVFVNAKSIAVGEGKSKGEAEQDAAKAALTKIL